MEEVKVLFEDNHLLVLNKPAGLLTQPSGTEQDSLETQAKKYIKEKYGKTGNVFLHAVHRLDKVVSGIVVFCKTSKALSRMNEEIRSKHAKKIYWAVVDKEPKETEGILEHYLVHDEFQARVSDDGKLARLKYKVIEYLLLEIELETGRYHQIRAQLSAAGIPIRGDVKYGSKTVFGDGRGIGLHHKHMEFEHPVTKEKVVVEAPFSRWA